MNIEIKDNKLWLDNVAHPIDVQRLQEKTTDSAEVKLFLQAHITHLIHHYQNDPLIRSILRGEYHEKSKTVSAY